MAGKCVPVYSRGGVVQISDNKMIDTKITGGRLPYIDKRPPLPNEPKFTFSYIYLIGITLSFSFNVMRLS